MLPETLFEDLLSGLAYHIGIGTYERHMTRESIKAGASLSIPDKSLKVCLPTWPLML